MQKTCTKCNQSKPLAEFYKEKANKDGRQRYCITCAKQNNSSWYKAANKQVTITIDVKICSCCGETKYYKEFHKQQKSKDGLQSRCKLCVNVTKKEWLLKNPNWAKDKYAALSEEKRKSVNLQTKNWCKINSEKVKQGNKNWRQANKEKHYQQSKKSRKKQYHNNPDVKIIMSLRTRLYQALKGTNKSNSTLTLLGCSIEHFKIYIKALFVEGMSWNNHGEWHLDHIKPCASFNLLDKEQQKECFHFTNFQPLWAEENINKSDKIDWIRNQT